MHHSTTTNPVVSSCRELSVAAAAVVVTRKIVAVMMMRMMMTMMMFHRFHCRRHCWRYLCCLQSLALFSIPIGFVDDSTMTNRTQHNRTHYRHDTTHNQENIVDFLQETNLRDDEDDCEQRSQQRNHNCRILFLFLFCVIF